MFGPIQIPPPPPPLLLLLEVVDAEEEEITRGLELLGWREGMEVRLGVGVGGRVGGLTNFGFTWMVVAVIVEELVVLFEVWTGTELELEVEVEAERLEELTRDDGLL